MRAMIMAAGVGNRLMPLTSSIPKPMVPICNVPVMEYGIELLKSHGIKNIIANLHYLPEKITGYFKEGQELDVNISYSHEVKLLGTAGGVKNNEWFLNSDTFVILSGDALTDIDLSDLISFHKKKGALATIALKKVKSVSEYGVVIRDNNDDKIIAFQEKPSPKEALSDLVNTGIYVFEPEIFDLIPEGKVYDFGKELFPRLVELGLPFYGYDGGNAYWCDVGNLKVYQDANIDVLKGKVKVSLKEKRISDDAEVATKAELNGQVVIGKNVKIEDDVIIKDSIIWPGSIVKKSATVINSIIGLNCIIEPGSVVKDAVLANETIYSESIIEDLPLIK